MWLCVSSDGGILGVRSNSSVYDCHAASHSLPYVFYHEIIKCKFTQTVSVGYMSGDGSRAFSFNLKYSLKQLYDVILSKTVYSHKSVLSVSFKILLSFHHLTTTIDFHH